MSNGRKKFRLYHVTSVNDIVCTRCHTRDVLKLLVFCPLQTYLLNDENCVGRQEAGRSSQRLLHKSWDAFEYRTPKTDNSATNEKIILHFMWKCCLIWHSCDVSVVSIISRQINCQQGDNACFFADKCFVCVLFVTRMQISGLTERCLKTYCFASL